MRKILLQLACVVLGLCATAVATAKIQGGCIQVMQPKALAIQRQDITLSLDKVTASYVLINNSALEIIETMALQAPYYPELQKIHVDEQPFNQLEIIVDGNKIEYKTITQPNAQLPTDLAQPPLWRPGTYYYWQQRFPPAVEVHITQNYKPALRVFKNNIPYKYQANNKKRDFWLPKMLQKNLSEHEKQNIVHAERLESDRQEVKILQGNLKKYFPYMGQFISSEDDYKTLLPIFNTAAGEKLLIARELQYPLANNNTWACPIENFTLKIDYPQNMLAYSNWPHKFSQTGSNTLMFSASNYIPSQDIAVLFVQR